MGGWDDQRRTEIKPGLRIPVMGNVDKYRRGCRRYDPVLPDSQNPYALTEPATRVTSDVRHHLAAPPSIVRQIPLTNDASSEAR
jgi:hypothetical protein